MNELDSAIFHFFATGAAVLSVWANAPVMGVLATASGKKSTMGARMGDSLLFRVTASRPPPESFPPRRCWARRALASLARTPPFGRRGGRGGARGEPPLED